MTCFCELSHYAQMAVIIITWLGVLAQLVLPLYRFFHRRSVIHTVLDGFLLYGLLVLLCFLVRYNQHVTQSDFHLPVPALICILVAAFAYSVISLIAEMRRSKREINEWSVKEAIDDLPVGLLFADADGHIILINRKMAELSHLLIDRLPRTLSDMTDALSSPPSESQVEAMTDVAGCCRFGTTELGRTGFTAFAAANSTVRDFQVMSSLPPMTRPSFMKAMFVCGRITRN